MTSRPSSDHSEPGDVPPAIAVAASRIASGDRVDWPAIGTSVGDSDSRDVLARLQEVEGIAAFHRGWQTAPLPASPSATWGSLVLLEEIGRGSFGRVYRARDSRLDREVALKILERGPSTDSPTAQAVVDEGRHLARLRHPNIVTIHGADWVDGRIGLEMELLAGRTLFEIVRTNGPFSTAEAALIGRDICRALAAVHQAGLVHRDIKAQNVMRERGGRIVLMDFGAGRLIDVIESSEVAGTPLYLAPEVLAGTPATPGSDLYSVGVLLFHLVTGQFPITATTIEDLRRAHLGESARGLRHTLSGLPDRFIDVLERTLAPNPEERFDSAGSIGEELSVILAEVGPSEGSDLHARLSMSELVNQHGPFSAEEACLLVRQVCLLLETAHAAGKAYGSLAADRIFREAGGHISIADRPVAASVAMQKADVRSTGGLLHFLVTGAAPFENGVRLRNARPDLPEGFIHLVERTITNDHAENTGGASGLIAALSRLVSGVEPGKPAAARRWRQQFVVGAAIAVGVTAAATIWLGSVSAEWSRVNLSVGNAGCDVAAEPSLDGSSQGSRAWQILDALPTPRLGLSVATLHCRLFAIGGVSRSWHPRSVGQFGLGGLDIYDPASRRWIPGAELPNVRAYPSSATVLDGKIYLTGGAGCDAPGCRETDTLFIYDPSRGPGGAWTTGPPMPVALQRGIAGTIGGHLYVVAGLTINGSQRRGFRFDPVTSLWSTIPDAPGTHDFAAGAVVRGKLYAAGGEGNQHGLDIYDPAMQTWESRTMPVGFQHHAAVAVGDYLVLFGGNQWVSGELVSYRVVMAYDTVKEVWSTADPIVSAGGPYLGRAGSPVSITGHSTPTWARLPMDLDLTSGVNIGRTLYATGGWDDPGGKPLDWTIALDPAGPEPLVYIWTFGDGVGGSGQNATHTYEAPGKYTITLTVSTADGRRVSATTTARIE